MLHKEEHTSQVGILLFTGVLYFNMHQLEQSDDLSASSIVLVETAAFANTSGGANSSDHGDLVGGGGIGDFDAKFTKLKLCPNGCFVIRCDIGGSNCEPEEQFFCDEVCP